MAAKAAKKETKKSAAPAAKAKGKPGRPPKAAAAPAESAQLQAPSADEIEEQEEAAAEAAASGGGGGNAAALAAAGGATEMSASFKNFRHHPDMENFYRFIFDNDLRHEALQIIDEIMLEKRRQKELKHAKKQAH